MNWRVVVHLLAERSQQLLLVKLFSSVLCPYKMTGPLPTYYKMGCFLLLPTHYSPTMPPQSERSSSHIPHHSKSCPYKMSGFLPNTYNRGWHCCSIFLSFSQAYNLRLWTVQNSSGFWHPSMVPSKKNADTHTEQQIFKLGFWCLLDLLQNGYLEFVTSKPFWMFQNAQGPSKPTFCLQNGSYIMVESSIRKTILIKRK